MFSDGLYVAMEKVEEYHEKMATSHAYTFLMCMCFVRINECAARTDKSQLQ